MYQKISRPLCNFNLQEKNAKSNTQYIYSFRNTYKLKKITAEEESNPKNKKEPTKQNHPISICKTKMQNLTHYRHYWKYIKIIAEEESNPKTNSHATSIYKIKMQNLTHNINKN